MGRLMVEPALHGLADPGWNTGSEQVLAVGPDSGIEPQGARDQRPVGDVARRPPGGFVLQRPINSLFKHVDVGINRLDSCRH